MQLNLVQTSRKLKLITKDITIQHKDFLDGRLETKDNHDNFRSLIILST